MFRRLALLACASGLLSAAEPRALIRLAQTGYAMESAKHARLLSKIAETGATFRLVSADGKVAASGSVGQPAGAWNAAWPFVYDLDFSALRTPGVYSIRVDGPAPAASQPVPIGTAADLYAPLLRNALAFFQTQRDGADVPPGALNRKPSHLADRQAFAYRTPAFRDNALVGELQRTGGPVDVSGGWADAGDYLKFVETASYVTAMMLQGARDYPAPMGPGGIADFAAEGRFGLDWLLKMWHAESATLYLQVGLGEGNAHAAGDHDSWRLPEADDAVRARAGSPQFFIPHRPVFVADPLAGKISPNLAGRLAAAFALGYQVFEPQDPAYAARLLAAAQQIYDLAATAGITRLVTTAPHGFYPEEQWRDDLEWGAVELHLALQAAHRDDDAARYLRLATHWARQYAASRDQDSLNLYDVSGIAHFDLCRALDRSASLAGLELSRADLLAQLKQRLDRAAARARQDPFALGFPYNGGDLTPHLLGLALEAGFYDELTGSSAFADFAAQQTAFVLGANAWGTSFIVGAGQVFPLHVHHQIANISGHLDGTAPVLLGAVVDGPSGGGPAALETPEGARPARWPGGRDPYAEFNRSDARYSDETGNWASVEPALDYTVPAALLFARRAAGLPD